MKLSTDKKISEFFGSFPNGAQLKYLPWNISKGSHCTKKLLGFLKQVYKQIQQHFKFLSQAATSWNNAVLSDNAQ